MFESNTGNCDFCECWYANLIYFGGLFYCQRRSCKAALERAKNEYVTQ